MAGPSDWRGETLAHIRDLIQDAEPDVAEEVKWRKPSNPAGVPVWSYAGILCTGETYKDKVKLTFAKGALLEDPSGLFNASLEGNVGRAIDIAHAVPLTLIAGAGRWLMGSVDLALLGSLLVGSIPGIIISSMVTARIPERVLRPILATTLLLVGAKLAFEAQRTFFPNQLTIR